MVRPLHDLGQGAHHSLGHHLVVLAAIGHVEVAAGKAWLEAVVLALERSEVELAQALVAFVGHGLPKCLGRRDLERVAAAFRCRAVRVVKRDATLRDLFASKACLLDAAFGQRRVAPPLGLVLSIEERLCVTQQVEGLSGHDGLDSEMAVGDAGAQGFRKPCLRWQDRGLASSRLHELLDAVPRDARKEVRDDDWGLVSDVIRIQKQLLAVVELVIV